MTKSSAMTSLDSSLGIVRALLGLEKTYSDPPLPRDAAVVEGLRAGSAVLVVAAFEEFLKSAFRDELTKLQLRRPDFTKLPARLQVESVFSQLDLAMKGSGQKAQRLPEILLAATRVSRQQIHPESLCSTQSNPSPQVVAQLFKDVAFDSVFETLKPRFERIWGAPVSAMFARDKLDEIVQRRHQVAHSGRALNVSRVVLTESVRFVKVLSATLELELRAHLRQVAASAK